VWGIRLASRWAELESFTITGECWVSNSGLSGNQAGAFEECSRLKMLRLDAVAYWSDLGAPLVNLPSSLRTLHLIFNDAFQQDPSADPVITYLATAVRNLVNLTFASNTSWGTRHVPRGLLNPVAAKLVNVERSAIPACAVTDLAASLAPLENLTELSLEGSFTLGLDPEASEVVGLIDAETGMRQLTLGKALHQRLFRGPPWSDQEWSEVERAAERKGMNLVWG
jgi:hypothetical protein